MRAYIILIKAFASINAMLMHLKDIFQIVARELEQCNKIFNYFV